MWLRVGLAASAVIVLVWTGSGPTESPVRAVADAPRPPTGERPPKPEPDPRVTGTVVSAGTRRPIEGAEVALHEIEGDRLSEPAVVTTRSDARGAFALPQQGRTGRLAVRATAPGHRPNWIQASPEDSFGSHEPVPAEPVVVPLDEGGAVTFRVVDEDDHPVETASVDVLARPRLRGWSTVRATIALDPGAEFTLLPVPGEKLRVGAKGYEGKDVLPSGLSAESTFFRIMLRRLTTLSGAVVDTAGRPISGADVTCTRLHPVYTTTRSSWATETGAKAHTDVDGRFACDALKPGPWSVGIRCEGYPNSRRAKRSFSSRRRSTRGRRSWATRPWS